MNKKSSAQISIELPKLKNLIMKYREGSFAYATIRRLEKQQALINSISRKINILKKGATNIWSSIKSYFSISKLEKELRSAADAFNSWASAALSFINVV